jgi:hypothetical protein
MLHHTPDPLSLVLKVRQKPSSYIPGGSGQKNKGLFSRIRYHMKVLTLLRTIKTLPNIKHLQADMDSLLSRSMTLVMPLSILLKIRGRIFQDPGIEIRMTLPDGNSPEHEFITVLGKSISPVGSRELLVLVPDGPGYGFRKPLGLDRKHLQSRIIHDDAVVLH